MNSQSLQDQLLKAGLVNKAKAKQVKTDKRKQAKKKHHNKVEIVDETKKLVQEAKLKLIEKDRILNEKRKKDAEKKQIANQISQLIELNKLVKDDEGVAYNFTDQNKVKVIYISAELRDKIIAGKLAIVKTGKSYEVVPVKVAEKIMQRDEQTVIVLFSESTEIKDDNDEYHGYEIPDDLMW